MTLLEAGLDRILYVDLDVQHGDGVQEAYREDQRVFTISIHEEKRWPGPGPVTDRAGGSVPRYPRGNL